MRQAVLKILPFILLATLICSAAEIEDKKPQRELTAEQKADADKLIEKIKAEKERLVDVRKPLNEAEAALKEPEAELRELKGQIGAINQVINDFEGKDPQKDAAAAIKDKLVPAAKALGSSGRKIADLASEIMKLNFDLATAKAAKKDTKDISAKLKSARKKYSEATDKITEKVQATVSKLDLQKREELAKFEDESKEINTLRAKLSLIYGYRVDNAALLFMGKDSNVGASVTAWINEQGKLIERLSAWGYEDLASSYFNKVQKGANPFDGKPFTDAQMSYLSKIGARLNKQKSIFSDNLVEKILLAQDSLKIFEDVVTKLVPQTPMHTEAVIDLIDSRFVIADSLYTQAWKDCLIAGTLPILAKDYALPAAKPVKKGAKPTPPAPEKVYTEAELKAMDTATLSQTAADVAYKYYSKGLKTGTPLQERNSDTFLDLIDNYTVALDDKDEKGARKALKMLEHFSPGKLRLQHSMEEGYSQIPSLLPFAAKQREEYITTGNTFIVDNLGDYQQIWPNDKRVYLNWMVMNSCQLDPVLQTTDKDKPLPDFLKPDEDEWNDMSKDEKQEEMLNLENYPWASTRVDNIFNWYIVGKKKNEAVKDNIIQLQRQRGLYSWSKARAQLAMNHFIEARKEADAAKKEKLMQHAQKLHKNALAAFAEIGKSNSIIGPVDQDVRNKTKLEVVLPYYLFMADNEIKAGNKDAASQWASQALSEAAAVKTAAEGAWIKLSGNALLYVDAFSKKNDLAGSDDPTTWPTALLATRAEELMRNGMAFKRDGKLPESKKAFEESYDLYLMMLDKARSLSNKSERENMIPKALYNFGAVAIQLEDYQSSIIAFQALVQEFRNDFADPKKNFPPEQYPNAAKYFDTALNNLRAAAYKQLRNRGNSLDRRNYVEALLMNVRSSGRGEDYVALIDTFIDMKEYLSAVEFIDNVPTSNDYYRITQLMAASVFVTMIKQDMNEIATLEEKINPTPDEDGKIPDDMKFAAEEKTKFKARQDLLRKNIKEYREQAIKYSQKFITLHKTALDQWAKDAATGLKVTPAVQNIREQEKQNLLQAMLIPMSLALESGDYAEVIKLTPGYFTAVEEQKGLPEEARQKYREDAAWINFNAVYRQVDYKKSPIADAVKNLRTAEAIQKDLAKYDKDEKYLTSAASLLGSAWMTLANRASADKNDALEKEYSLNSVNWLVLAEKRIYTTAPLGIKMGQTLTEQKMYPQAENVLGKVVNFWAESRFTESSLFAKNKGLKDMKAMDISVSSELSGPFKSGSITAAANDKALEDTLNELIASVKFEDNAEAFNKALAKALEANKDNKSLNRSIEQGIHLAASFAPPSELAAITLNKRPYLNLQPDQQVRNRLNRILLETAYPGILYIQPVIPLLPSPATTAEQTRTILKQYTSQTGRHKAAVLMAMIDPMSIEGTSAEQYVYGEKSDKGKGGFVGELLQKIKDSTNDAEKKNMQSWVDALQNPLMVSLYGEKDKKGILRKRSYGRAQLSIMAMMSYNKSVESSEEFPCSDYVKDLTKALGFQSLILVAKKDYAKAMVENSNYAKAEKYVKELNVLFPNDWSLTLDLGTIYTSMASKERVNGKLVPRPFSKEAAKYYMQGMIQINSIYKFSSPGSEPYWEATMLSFENDLKFVESRFKGAAEFKKAFDVEIAYFDPKSNKSRTLNKTVDPLEKQGRTLAIDIQRTINRTEPKADAQTTQRLEEMLEKLAKLGFTIPKVN